MLVSRQPPSDHDCKSYPCCGFISEDPAYDYLEGEYGTIPFKIDSDTYYPSDWQRVNGDPHGQAAEEEAPDPLGDETLSFDFPDTDSHYNVHLWTHDSTGKSDMITVDVR